MDTLALRGVSVCLEPATTTALVGTSGSGKSTIASLVLRLFDPTAGGIFIDGDRLDALDVVRHRRRIGVVQQEPCLFDRTVFENIAYGLDPPPSRQRVIDAAIASNLDDVVKRLANGYDERLGEHSRLSGGEKQRRAFQVRDPNLLLLDEATSALDAQSEAVVIEALDAAARGRTTLTVAHRLATIRRADSIVVMDKGLIVDQGTHSALMRRDGLYKRLVDQQVGSPPQPKQPKKAPRAKTVFRNADDDTDTDTSLRRSFGDTAYD
ncbi:P-loop containing nucleoside triphosphate hydrolase protein [Pelagophyceae sp. CCMP2097]|nr:P-loop containing nucleoside triphosphate hydrolase protein [Pelagophyceae sp. CCMP2097]